MRRKTRTLCRYVFVLVLATGWTVAAPAAEKTAPAAEKAVESAKPAAEKAALASGQAAPADASKAAAVEKPAGSAAAPEKAAPTLRRPLRRKPLPKPNKRIFPQSRGGRGPAGAAEDEGKNPTEKTEKLRYEDISNRRSPSVGK